MKRANRMWKEVSEDEMIALVDLAWGRMKRKPVRLWTKEDRAILRAIIDCLPGAIRPKKS